MKHFLTIAILFAANGCLFAQRDTIWQTISESEFEYRIEFKADSTVLVEERYIDTELGDCEKNIWKYAYQMQNDTVTIFADDDTAFFVSVPIDSFFQKFDLKGSACQTKVDVDKHPWADPENTFYHPVFGKYYENFKRKWKALNCGKH